MRGGNNLSALAGLPRSWLLVALGASVVLLAVGVMTVAKGPVTLSGHTKRVMSVAFSPDGTTLASVSWDTTIKLWDVKLGKEVATLELPEGEYAGPEASRGGSSD